MLTPRMVVLPSHPSVSFADRTLSIGLLGLSLTHNHGCYDGCGELGNREVKPNLIGWVDRRQVM